MSSGSPAKKTAVATLMEFSVPLIAGVVAAVLWANLDHAGYERFVHYSPFGSHSPLSVHFVANELLMVFFFGIATKEITEACLPGGALNPPRKAINPLLGTLGGILGPVSVYLAMAWLLDAPEVRHGWGIPTATDIALAWLAARVVFGKRHPAVSFLLLLAVADDAAGLAIIAVFYPDPHHPVQIAYLGLVVAGMALAWLLKRQGVTGFWPYVLLAGGSSWFGLYAGHLHPALALVPIVPFMPNRGRDEGLFRERGDGYPDTLNQFESFFKTPVDLGLALFGLANAGVAFSTAGPATWCVLTALLVGKTAGITTFSGVAHALGFDLPTGMNLRTLVTAALTAALGLTVALFVAGVAFVDPDMQAAGKMGALFSAAAAPLALLLGWLLRIKKKHTMALGEPEPVINPSGRPSLRGPAEPSDEDMDLDASAGEPAPPARSGV